MRRDAAEGLGDLPRVSVGLGLVLPVPPPPPASDPGPVPGKLRGPEQGGVWSYAPASPSGSDRGSAL